MILSKLILFSCFYLLLFLDNSLGQKALVTQVGNEGFFKRAIKFGQTYGGELGELGSQWKQLLIQLVHAKQNVGLGKYQLARFNDSATTEEVGLAITDSYADRVAELVAIRTQDIGATQIYIDELEILKNEIALTMIVEMDEIEEQFKEKNVREKVKEAKENGLTDEDIKELLFAQFIDSGEGLSLVGGRASIADRLLSSFLNGMKSILYGTYSKELGIIQYGNEDPKKNIDHPLAESDDDNSIKYVLPGSCGGASGGAAFSGGASGGGGSGGPPTSPPSGPPGGANVPDDSHEEEGDEEKDKERDKEEAKLRKCLAKTLRMDDEVTPTGKLIPLPRLQWVDAFYNQTERQKARDHVRNTTTNQLRDQLASFKEEIRPLFEEYSIAFDQNPSVRGPIRRAPTDDEIVELATRRINHYRGLLNRAQDIRVRVDEWRKLIKRKYNLTQDNVKYYQARRSLSAGESLPPQPARIVEIENIPAGMANIESVEDLVVEIAWQEMRFIEYFSGCLDTELVPIIRVFNYIIGTEENCIRMVADRRGPRG